jgi:hypothetical protein
MEFNATKFVINATFLITNFYARANHKKWKNNINQLYISNFHSIECEQQIADRKIMLVEIISLGKENCS